LDVVERKQQRTAVSYDSEYLENGFGRPQPNYFCRCRLGLGDAGVDGPETRCNVTCLGQPTWIGAPSRRITGELMGQIGDD
jgi:hypothetical protein